MTQIIADNAQGPMAELLDHVLRGESVTIVRNGSEVAKVEPVKLTSEKSSHFSKLVEDWIKYRDERGFSTGGMTIKQMIEEGRK